MLLLLTPLTQDLILLVNVTSYIHRQSNKIGLIPDEIQRQVTMSDTKLIFAVRETIDVVKEALKLSQRNIPIIVINLDGNLPEGTISFKELVEDSHIDVSILNEVKSKGEDVAFLPYSSGTTGLPKGVELTHTNIVANLLQQDTECRQYEYTTGKKINQKISSTF